MIWCGGWTENPAIASVKGDGFDAQVAAIRQQHARRLELQETIQSGRQRLSEIESETNRLLSRMRPEVRGGLTDELIKR